MRSNLNRVVWSVAVIEAVVLAGWVVSIIRTPAVHTTPPPATTTTTTVAPRPVPEPEWVWSNCEPGEIREVTLTIRDDIYPDHRGVRFYVRRADRQYVSDYDRTDFRGPREGDEFHATARMLQPGDLYLAYWNDENGTRHSASFRVGRS